MPISLFADHTALIKTLISDSLNTPCTLNAPFWQQRSRNWSAEQQKIISDEVNKMIARYLRKLWTCDTFVRADMRCRTSNYLGLGLTNPYSRTTPKYNKRLGNKRHLFQARLGLRNHINISLGRYKALYGIR